jgi:thiol-disulfide isomerase/thioredoxin
MSGRAVHGIVFVLAALLALSIQALARQPFDAKAFEQAQAAGKTVLLHVHASWCPTCRRQEPVVEKLAKERPGLVIYVVDYDRDKGTLKKLGVTSQATLVLFKGATEVGRLVARLT